MGPEESGGLRCSQCGATVRGTRHTRTGYTVGHYVLHTGRTGEATRRRRDDEAPLTYRRLLDTLEDVQRLWLAFGDRGELGGMSAGGGP